MNSIQNKLDSFPIYKVEIDKFNRENKGTKEKYWDEINHKKCLIKFNNRSKDDKCDIRSANVSEKIYSEIANYLEIECVKTDFIVDDRKRFGIASYDFKKEGMFIVSGDDLFFSVFNRIPNKKGDNISSTDYTYDNIVKILFYYDQKGDLLKKFNSMLVLDALFGEGDRHHENWGLYKDESTNEKYDFLPIYDNSSCLLHQLREEQILKKFILSKDMQSYVKKSKSKITIGGKKYTHFEFIDYLLENLPNEFKNDLQKNIENLNKLTDDYIYKLINRIPCDVCSMEHKNLIIQYIIIRRDLLLSKVV